MLTCCWALSLFGVEQCGRILAPATLEALTSRTMTQLACELLQQSAAVVKLLMPGRNNRLAWQELANKLQAFDLFEHVDVLLHLQSEPEVPLAALVQQAEALGPYRAVWALEGLGRYYAETYWEHHGTPWHLFATDAVCAVPVRSLMPLHTGLGLSLADRLLAALTPHSPEADIDTILRQFIALCQHNAREGYLGAVLEALGLVVRLRYAPMVHIVDRRLSVIAPEIVSYFWHGVGRGLYFLPDNALPCGSSAWRAVEMTQTEAPHACARLNALGGLAWAITLVNIRHPAILETWLMHYGDVLSANEAFATGVSAALLIWYDIARDDPYLMAFLEHRPDRVNPRLVQLWDSQVLEPSQVALHQHYSVLQARHGLGELFRHQPLAVLVDRLTREPVE